MPFINSIRPTMGYRPPELAQRWVAEVLDHTYRNRISTLPSLNRVVLPADFARNSVTKICSSAVELGYLQRWRIHAQLPGGPRTYFTIGQRAVSRFGWSRHRAQQLNEQRLAEELATLACCCERNTPVQRLLPEELADMGVLLTPELKNWPYYTDNETLFSIRVFRRSSANAIARKVAADLYRYDGNPTFRALIQQRKFGLTLIASSHRLDLAAEILNDTLLAGDRRTGEGALHRSVQLAGYAWDHFLHFA